MDNQIIVLGAGRSATVLLQYLNQLAQNEGFRFTIADADSAVLAAKTSLLTAADAVVFSAFEPAEIAGLIGKHTIVISLLPPPMHPLVAKACLVTKSNLITASYESAAMRELAGQAEAAGLIFLNECGLDPGIDHMSAMEIIEDLRRKGAKIKEFYSYCGGLVADECDDNPFKYKISWNPRNVVLAGKGTSRFRQDGRTGLLPYHRLFAQPDQMEVPGWGQFEGYANRDSEPYIQTYGLAGIETLKRGTLRKPGFCERWNALVQLGLTEDENVLDFGSDATYADFMATFVPGFFADPNSSLERAGVSPKVVNDILDMGFRPAHPAHLKRTKGTSADFLLDLIVDKWVLRNEDQDLVVMVHVFNYELEGIDYQTISSFGMKGRNSVETAMAATVGLPLGIIAKQMLHNQIRGKGLLLPLHNDIYEPVLKELSSFGIQFQTETKILH